MPRRKIRQPEATEQTPEEFEEVSQDEEEGLEKSPPTYNERFRAFIDRHDLKDREPLFYLYKFTSNFGNSESFIAKWEGQFPPDEQEIAMKFGGGRYRMIMTVPGDKERGIRATSRTVTFNIHSMYDDLAETPINGARKSQYVPGEMRELISVLRSSSQQSDGTSSGGQNPFDMVERILALLIPLIAQKNNGPDMAEVMTRMYTNTQDVMKKQLMENIGMYSQVTKMIATGGDLKMLEQPEVEEKEETIIDKILPYVDQILPKLLGGGAKAEVTSNLVRTLPQFKAISKDRESVKKLISWLDENHGSDTTNKVLESLKLKRM